MSSIHFLTHDAYEILERALQEKSEQLQQRMEQEAMLPNPKGGKARSC